MADILIHGRMPRRFLLSFFCFFWSSRRLPADIRRPASKLPAVMVLELCRELRAPDDLAVFVPDAFGGAPGTPSASVRIWYSWSCIRNTGRLPSGTPVPWPFRPGPWRPLPDPSSVSVHAPLPWRTSGGMPHSVRLPPSFSTAPGHTSPRPPPRTGYRARYTACPFSPARFPYSSPWSSTSSYALC